MFPPNAPPPAWDDKGEYTADKLVVYAVTRRKRVLKVGRRMSLADVCRAAGGSGSGSGKEKEEKEKKEKEEKEKKEREEKEAAEKAEQEKKEAAEKAKQEAKPANLADSIAPSEDGYEKVD